MFFNRHRLKTYQRLLQIDFKNRTTSRSIVQNSVILLTHVKWEHAYSFTFLHTASINQFSQQSQIRGGLVARSSFRRFKISNFGTNVCLSSRFLLKFCRRFQYIFYVCVVFLYSRRRCESLRKRNPPSTCSITQ